MENFPNNIVLTPFYLIFIIINEGNSCQWLSKKSYAHNVFYFS